MSGTAYAVAFSGGVVSFLSPCVLPLVPVYLSVTTGTRLTDLGSGGRDGARAVTRGAGLFCLGFSVVFVALGLSVTAVGAALTRHQVPITRFAGVVVAGMAITMLMGTVLRGRLAPRERRFHPDLASLGRWAAPVAGAAFGFGWTPCIGPVLGSVLAVAAEQGRVLEGGALLATYSVGLALPFLLTGLAFGRAVGALRWSRRHSVSLTRSSAALLVLYGVVLALGQLPWMTLRLQEAAQALGLSSLVALG